MRLALAMLAVPALICACHLTAIIRWYRQRRRDLPLTHPAWKPALTRFRTGPMPSHEDSRLTAAERIALERIAQEEAWLDLTADERQWIGDAVKGRAEGEKAPLPESED